jgi:hypothetical protein
MLLYTEALIVLDIWMHKSDNVVNNYSNHEPLDVFSRIAFEAEDFSFVGDSIASSIATVSASL